VYRTGGGLQVPRAQRPVVEVRMSSVEVRPFRRSDREQLTALVNAHVQAVVPGVSVSVNTVMSQLERDPGEFIVDPWVTDRVTLVAGQRRRVVATAHLLRYGGGEEVGDCYRDAGEINWLLHWSARRPTGCDWRGSSGCSTTPPPTSTITRRCWDASASASSPARPAAGSTRGR